MLLNHNFPAKKTYIEEDDIEYALILGLLQAIGHYMLLPLDLRVLYHLIIYLPF